MYPFSANSSKTAEHSVAKPDSEDNKYNESSYDDDESFPNVEKQPKKDD